MSAPDEGAGAPSVQQASFFQLMRRMLPLLAPQRGQVLLALGLIAIWTGTNLAGP